MWVSARILPNFLFHVKGKLEMNKLVRIKFLFSTEAGQTRMLVLECTHSEREEYSSETFCVTPWNSFKQFIIMCPSDKLNTCWNQNSLHVLFTNKTAYKCRYTQQPSCLGYVIPHSHLIKWEVNQYIMIGWKSAVATVI